jgi:16S rRNA (cytidine1402-2'-O)-methyltransferase
MVSGSAIRLSRPDFPWLGNRPAGGLAGPGASGTIDYAAVGTLLLVATPIGNLEDLSPRAKRLLADVEQVYAEDTRRTLPLLRHFGIAARPRSLHAHNERTRRAEVLDRLAAGQTVALVSDAGSPVISDPGADLVDAALDAGHRVVPVPGPSAVIAALSASGFSAVPFAFLGFLPRKAGPQRKRLEAYAERPETLVLFESPHRLGVTLSRAAEVLGERRACVARELTKLHEEIVRGELAELADRFREGTRGEITLVIEGSKRL